MFSLDLWKGRKEQLRPIRKLHAKDVVFHSFAAKERNLKENCNFYFL